MVQHEKIKTKNMVYMGMMVALISVCAWISIPAAVPFTMQTFAVFVAAGLLGGKRSGIALLCYVLLGAVGVPVFAGFKGGVAAIVGPTGGYIIGFILAAVVAGFLMDLMGRSLRVMIIAMLAGLFACYFFGTVWFVKVYSATKGSMDVSAALGMCVIPYIIPDCIKIALSIPVIKGVSRAMGELL